MQFIQYNRQEFINSQIPSFVIAQPMDNRLRNVPNNKRVFGKDITNLERRAKANSISQKPPQLIQHRLKSRSFEKKPPLQPNDPICDHQQDILSFMLSLQTKQRKELTTNITAEMRQILIDWLIDVHSSFDLKEQTLQLALAYLNHYSSLVDITKHDYQLVGTACLWIASKYEEIYPPRMQNYVQVTDSSYSASELKTMEGKILLALDFNLNHTTPLAILEAISDKWAQDASGRLTKDSQRTLAMAKYVIELSLYEGLGKQYCMKTIVLSALMVADTILKMKSETKVLEGQKVDKEAMLKCFKEMCLALQNITRPNSKLKALKKKYADQKYLGVSRFRVELK